MAIPNRGPELLGVNIAFLSTAILACALRCFVRVKMVKAFGRDDWLMVSALFFFIMYTTSSNIGIHYGTGRHHRDLSIKNIEKARHCWFFCYLFYSMSTICSKLSIGFLLLRISVSKIHTWILYAAMLTSAVAGGAFFFVCLFQCYPVSYMWDRTSQSGSCVDSTVITALGYMYSVFSIVSDFTFAIIPGFLVCHLQLKRRAKAALVPLIAMGCIASGAVIARFPFMRYLNSPDFLWSTTDIAIWSTVEQGLAITAGSLATLRPLFYLAVHTLGLTTRSSHQRPSGYAMSAPLPANAASNSHDHKSENLHPDMYKLPTATETRCSADEESVRHMTEFPKSSNWFSRRSVSKERTRIEPDNESQRNFNAKSESGSDEDGMHIVVSKTFCVTDEERVSRSSHR